MDCSKMPTSRETSMSLSRILSLLEGRAARDTCDGDCDAEPPHDKCAECRAASALNEADPILRSAL